jgi:hypothetical protein
MGTRSFTVEVRITINDDADPFEVMEEMDYSFTHDSIVDTEVVDATVADEPADG